jgi:dihydrodipicolinate synthase/N-acetylneuraminate lyase
MPKNIEGIIAAVPTPLTADGKVLDLENIKKQCDRYVEDDLHGVLITGSTGEFPALSVDEHKQTTKTFIDAIAGRMSAIAGIGANSTDLAIELAQFAEKTGADAVTVAPPFYETLCWKALYPFYEEICRFVSIPVIYYNFPDGTGVKLIANQVRVLSKIKNLDYMKDW